MTKNRQTKETPVAALAGNPNVGKSTIFNALTGMRQHTGNWPGKTVSLAQGVCVYKGEEIRLVDLPGTYALVSKSQEEILAAGFISGGEADCVIAVCDATSLERSLILALQVMELTDRVIVCVNLMDEARRKGVAVDVDALSRGLDAPVVTATARSGQGMDDLRTAVLDMARCHLSSVCRLWPRRRAEKRGWGSFSSSCGGFWTALKRRGRGDAAWCPIPSANPIWVRRRCEARPGELLMKLQRSSSGAQRRLQSGSYEKRGRTQKRANSGLTGCSREG